MDLGGHGKFCRRSDSFPRYSMGLIASGPNRDLAAVGAGAEGMDDPGFAGPLLDEARICIERNALAPARAFLTRALVGLGESSDEVDPKLREDLARLFLDVGEPEKAVYALGDRPETMPPPLVRRASYEAAAALRGGGAPVDLGSPFVRRMLRLPDFQPEEIRRTYREMADLLDPHRAAHDKNRNLPPPAIVAENIYTICMMPRSGSNFLVKYMTNT